MPDDAPSPSQTKALAYGGVASWIAVIGGILVYGTGTSLWEETVLVASAALLLAEGLGLVTNWRGSADEVTAIVRSRPPVRDSLVATYLGKTSFVRNTLGPAAIVLAGLFLWAAVRGPTH
jgi:hypothetical protein